MVAPVALRVISLQCRVLSKAKPDLKILMEPMQSKWIRKGLTRHLLSPHSRESLLRQHMKCFLKKLMPFQFALILTSRKFMWFTVINLYHLCVLENITPRISCLTSVSNAVTPMLRWSSQQALATIQWLLRNVRLKRLRACADPHSNLQLR